MAKSAVDLVTLVRQKCSIVNSQVCTDPEIVSYLNEALRSLYDLLISVDSSYYESSFDYVLASSPTGAIGPFPPDFYKMRGLERYPDTTKAYPVFLLPFSERRRGKTGYTLDGNNITVVPWSVAGDGPWRLYYTPKAPQFGMFTVRLCAAAALPLFFATGHGPGKTLTAVAPGALSIDGTAVAVGDLILDGKESPGTDNGIYVVTDKGSGGTSWILTRYAGYDEANEIHLGDLISVTAGATLAGTRQTVTSWPAGAVVDTTSISFGATTATAPLTTLDVTLDNFDEYVSNKGAMAVFAKRQMDAGLVPGLFAAAEARVRGMASQRASEPEQAPIMWRPGHGGVYGDDC